MLITPRSRPEHSWRLLRDRQQRCLAMSNTGAAVIATQCASAARLHASIPKPRSARTAAIHCSDTAGGFAKALPAIGNCRIACVWRA